MRIVLDIFVESEDARINDLCNKTTKLKDCSLVKMTFYNIDYGV